MGEGSKEAIAAQRPAKEQAEAELKRAIADKEAYEKQYRVFCKLLKASRKEVPLSEITDCIEQIVVDVDRKIVVKWTEERRKRCEIRYSELIAPFSIQTA